MNEVDSAASTGTRPRDSPMAENSASALNGREHAEFALSRAFALTELTSTKYEVIGTGQVR